MRGKALLWLFCLLLVVVVVAIAQTWRANQRLTQNQVEPQPAVITKLPGEVTIFSTDPVRGNASAQVTVVEFSDFECPYCAQSEPEVQTFLTAHPTARVVWKDFPLPSHPQAEAAAEAAQCAAQQGKFWEYHDLLFANQSQLSDNLYLSLASQLKLSLTEFARCTQNHDPLALVQRNVAEGQAVGVDGTPFFIVGNQVHSGTVTAVELGALVP